MTMHFGWWGYLGTSLMLIMLCSAAWGEQGLPSADSRQGQVLAEDESESPPPPKYELFPSVRPGSTSRRPADSGDPPPPPDRPASPPQERQPAPPSTDPVVALYGKTISGVVRLVVKRADGVAYGSGFVIGGKGIIVTGYHCIEGASRGVVTFHDGQNRLIQGVLAYDPRQDLALIKVDPGDMTLHPLRLSMKVPEAGAKVIAVGNPQGFFGTLTEGTIKGIHTGDRIAEDYPGLRDDMVANPGTEWVLSDAGASAGNSGGPLLAADGKVVGVNVWSWPGGAEAGPRVSFAASARKVMELIGRAELSPRPLNEIVAKEFPGPPTQKAVEAKRAARTRFDFAQDWRSGKPQPRSKVSESVARALAGIRCRRCNGTGSIQVQVVRDEDDSFLLRNRKRHVTKTVTCSGCSGTAIQVTELSYVRLLSMTEGIMNINSRPMTAESLARTREAAINVFRKIVGARNVSRSDCKGSPPQALNRDRPTVGKAVVFYGRSVSKFHKAGQTIVLMRTHDTGRTVIVLMPDGLKVKLDTWYLVGGLTAGLVTINSDDGVLRHRGVEAFAAEPAP